MKRKFFSILLVITLLCVQCTLLTTATETGVSVIVDEKLVQFDVAPRLIGGRTMVPLRAIFKALGATVNWDETTKTVTAFNEISVVKCTIGSNTMYVNNVARAIDVAPMIIEDRTLVPARFVAEGLNCDVQWNAEKMTVYIVSKPIDYSKVEQSDNKETEQPTSEQENKAVFYSGTSIPKYDTIVSGTYLLYKDGYTDGGKYVETYVYESDLNSKQDYVDYLEENGWNFQDAEVEDECSSWYLTKGKTLILISYYFSNGNVFLTFGDVY